MLVFFLFLLLSCYFRSDLPDPRFRLFQDFRDLGKTHTSGQILLHLSAQQLLFALVPALLNPGFAILLHMPLLIILKYTHRSRLRFVLHQEVPQYVFLYTLIDRAVHCLLFKM